MKIATNEWKSNLTNLSVGESGLTLESSNQLREHVTKVSQDVKKLQSDMKSFVNQVYKLQDLSKSFEREMKSLKLSVEDASRVCVVGPFSRFRKFCLGNTKSLRGCRSSGISSSTSGRKIHHDRT